MTLVRRAVFLDRDGVIIKDMDYLSRPEDLRLLPGAARALRALRRAGYKTIVVSNQSGVARGYFTEAALRRVHAALRRRLGTARPDAIYYCPHGPDDGCACRKPGIAMLRAAARRFKLDLTASWMVGDKRSDVLAGRRAGCRTILVRTGKAEKAVADHECRDLAAAARWILTTSS